MIAVQPKARFLESEESASAFRGIVSSDVFQKATIYALADFIQTSRPTTEELAGARKFLDVLNNLAELPVEASKLPVRTLSSLTLPTENIPKSP